ncbi:MAG: glycosyltransferase involved in cell wall biosynthesis [Pseudohongiellaceae bacterium]|jgi:glycosyltransferase involved in cell wall biosynthesis
MNDHNHNPENRLRIYALLGTAARLDPVRGDMINEARFLTALTEFADVYYNGCRFQPDKPDYGLVATDITPPRPDYDLYYVRANPEIFLQCPHPKIAMAYPYHEEVINSADALIVTTDAWKQGLLPYSPDNSFSIPMRRWYGDVTIPDKKIINIKQTINPDFIDEPGEDEITEARARLSLARAFGYFGRIDANTFPKIFLSAFQLLRKTETDLQFAVGGTVRIPLNRACLRLPRLPHHRMPALLTACLGTVTDEGDDAFFLGSGKVLDSMARGVPVIAYKTPPRVEQLGEDYPLYYDTEQSCLQRIREVLYDTDILSEARKQLKIRTQIFLPTTRAASFRKDLEDVLGLKTS